MKVRYTERALGEIDEILSYVAKDNQYAAVEVAEVLRATVRRLSEYPRLAIETTELGVRVMPVLPYRYLIFYSIDGDSIMIRNVRHSARARNNL